VAFEGNPPKLGSWELINGWLGEAPFLAGHHPTIADILAYTELSGVENKSEEHAERYPNVEAWFGRVAAIDCLA
jgi:glutathione S-transferase